MTLTAITNKAGIIGLLCLALSQALWADEKTPSYLTVTWENDLFTLKDGGYTNGFAVSWAYGTFDYFTSDNITPWIYQLVKNLPINTLPNKQRGISYSVGQGMQTPSDISQKQLISNDFPYAGITIWRADLYAFDDKRVDKLGLVLGFAGPLSGAKTTQIAVHKLTHSEKPKGWDNQLKNEMVFQISRERLWRLVDVRRRIADFDIVGMGNLAIGNLESHVLAGFSFRLGHALDRSFATASAMPDREINPLAGNGSNAWSLFLNISGSFVANSLLINGNTFQDGPSLPLQHWQSNVSAGFAFSVMNWAFLLSMTTGSQQFKGQATRQRFGSLNVTYHFNKN